MELDEADCRGFCRHIHSTKSNQRTRDRHAHSTRLQQFDQSTPQVSAGWDDHGRPIKSLEMG